MRVDHKGIHAPGIESLWRMKAKKKQQLAFTYIMYPCKGSIPMLA